jgi:hypothetical protein
VNAQVNFLSLFLVPLASWVTFPFCKCFGHYFHLVLEMSFNSIVFSVGSRSPMIFIGCFARNINYFFPLVVHARRWCSNLNEEQAISAHWGPSSFSSSWHAKMSLIPSELIQNVFCPNLHTTSKHATQTYRPWKVFLAEQPTHDQMSYWPRGYFFI